jgi:transcriptional regulator with XRE-family HTH domain
MSFDKLKGKMAEIKMSQEKLSRCLGITVQSLNAKLNGRSQFTLEEVVKITKELNIKDPVDIFFNPSVPKMQQLDIGDTFEPNGEKEDS